MVAIHKLFVFATAVSAASLISKRAFPAVFSGLKTINTDTNKLNTAISNFKASDPSPVLNAESALESEIKKVTSETNSSPSATTAQAKQALSYIKGTLIPTIKKTLSTAVKKKSAFQSAGFAGVVLSDLKSLSSEAAALGTALSKKAPATFHPSASSEISVIKSAFNSAIKAYS